MTALRLLADVVQEYCAGKKSGLLCVSIEKTSENLLQFYLKNGRIYNLSFGPAKDKDCLDILDCYDLDTAIYFDGLKAFYSSTELPPTEEIITEIRKSGKQVHVD